jgi:hypothetical protein
MHIASPRRYHHHHHNIWSTTVNALFVAKAQYYSFVERQIL